MNLHDLKKSRVNKQKEKFMLKLIIIFHQSKHLCKRYGHTTNKRLNQPKRDNIKMK